MLGYDTGKPFPYYVRNNGIPLIVVSASVDGSVENPTILRATVLNKTRTQACFKVELDQAGSVYYMYSTYTRRQFLSSEVAGDKQIPNFSAPLNFGKVSTLGRSQHAKLCITGLREETRYTVSFSPQGLLGQLSDQVETLHFTTKDAHLPILFNIYVKTLSSVNTVINGCAKVMGVPTSYLKLVGYDPALIRGPGRRMEDLTPYIYYKLALTLAPDADYELNPMNLVLLLENNKELLQSYIPELDTDKTITASAFEEDYPRLEVESA